MDTPPRSTPAAASSEKSAAGHAWGPSRGRIVIAVLLCIAAGVMLTLLWMPSRPATDVAATPAPLPAQAKAPAQAPVAATVPGAPDTIARKEQARAPEGDADPTPDLKSYVARGENPSMAEVIERLHERGIHSGLGAFSPPGTSPPLVGLAVPEDFVLPKGYVRHHQATDDGQRIEAVLMFAPDFQLLDAAGKPVAMPKNGIVPPELAPPGLPIRRIVIPPAIAQTRPGR
ncbi:hypothetical protein RBA41_03695 [Massilia sp. CCM 9210]|uniref:hypothetical protein n=1 Tax=Massilia scottii TaxID=3057166 RepID=UPI002796821D|nr:hypothetical protein [Massilia sp. CCM 9210]MDQ1812399.1 hypothetical protein [Massilia sp. CCM 9210]